MIPRLILSECVTTGPIEAAVFLALVNVLNILAHLN